MTESQDAKKANDLLGIGHWPRWKQIALFVLIVGAVLVASQLVEAAIGSHLGSPQARKIKAKIEPFAEQLEKAQIVGDKQAAIDLLDPTSKFVSDYNDLDEVKKAEINNSSLRYCVLATINLSGGVVEVVQTGYWVSKPKYEAALEACK